MGASDGVAGQYARLLDENEQLRTALEEALEENGRIHEDHDRLTRRVTTLAGELQRLKMSAPVMPPPPAAELAALTQSQAEEELRVAFEELQVLTEELEVSNNNLQRANEELEERVRARTRELTAANGEMRRSQLRLSALVEGIPQLVWRALDGGEWTWCSSQWTRLTGLSESQSRDFGWLEALHPDDQDVARAAWANAEQDTGLSFEARICDEANGCYRHFQTRAVPTRNSEGAVLEWLGTCTDVDDLLRLRNQQSVLVGELQHRTRNIMAIVEAVTRKTVKGSRSLEEFQDRIDGRLAALGRTQGLLSKHASLRVTLDELLRQELSVHVELDAGGEGRQVSLDGPAGVPLATSLVQTFGLAIHELTTNAIKYGALSVPGGRLEINWSIAAGLGDKQRLSLLWIERGVTDLPARGTPPRGGGYGRELIERALPYQLGAATSFGFTDDGVRCTIEVDVPIDLARREVNHAKTAT